MRIGVPKEIKPAENRVAMTPHGVAALVRSGHEVYIQTGVNIYQGQVTHIHVAETFGLPYTPVRKI